jgi:hypothetical protein
MSDPDPLDLAARITTAAIKYVRNSDTSRCHLNDCIGPLSGTTCECGWADMSFAVGALERANENSELRSLLDELGVEATPQRLRELLRVRGWSKPA